MRRNFAFYYLMLLITLTLSSCSVIGDLLKAGFWAGVVVTTLIFAGLFFVVKKFF